ncbi:MAG TPA: hypothetical protein VH092_24390 [Urbifossiella sp.]|jgi:hypothetical protein|nr:hypothetical protein [Urbifossiella sp.]
MRIVCAFATVFFLAPRVGCGTRPAPPPAGTDERPIAPSGTAPATPPAAPDESLTPDEYIRLGLPAHDRVWLGHDMAQAAKVLSAVAKAGGRRLPRYESERSGAVFSRLTSPHNLDGLRNRSLAVDARLPLATNYIQASNQVLKLYLAAFLKNEVRDSELVELMGAQLRATVVVLDLVDEFLPTLNKEDATYPVRMRGLEGMKMGLGSVVAGCLQTLTERDSYRAGELVRLVGYMEETFPHLATRLPPGSRTELVTRLRSLQDDPAMRDLRPGLERIRSGVTAAREGK